MVNSCVAYDCTNRRVKGDSMKFHRFPLNNKELCAKWIVAMKRDKFIPTKNSYLCGDHFIPTDYKYVDSIKLKDNAVPSIFKLPDHFMKIVKTRKPPIKRKFVEVSGTLSESCSSYYIINRCIWEDTVDSSVHYLAGLRY